MLYSDEKWFYGLVARTFAKACESLGVQKQSFSCEQIGRRDAIDRRVEEMKRGRKILPFCSQRSFPSISYTLNKTILLVQNSPK